jgi:very-short-patch-repair endonuclease
MPSLRARELRSNATDAERKLWQKIRRRQVEGFRFRRQVPIGPYIVDFACLAARLVVELDGGQHTEDHNIADDERRTAWLNSQGFRVNRFWNLEVLQNVDGVWENISAALAETVITPHPSPPPQGGRG